MFEFDSGVVFHMDNNISGMSGKARKNGKRSGLYSHVYTLFSLN